MSSTRRADPDSPLRQERYCSAPEFEPGLRANLVAKRCELVANPEHRELVWSLQYRHLKDGGFEKLSEKIAAAFPERVGTKSMLEIGRAAGVYSAEELDCIRAELPSEHPIRLLRRSATQAKIATIARSLARPHGEEQKSQCVEGAGSVSRETLFASCRDQLTTLPALLTDACINPAIDLATWQPWFFPQLLQSVAELFSAERVTRRAQIVETELASKVTAALDYALSDGCMVLVYGIPGTGKTFAAKAWCEQNAGRARFVQVPSSGDDIGFYRRIAQAIGTASALSLKGVQLRERVEQTLQASKLMLVLDEAHFCWPQQNRREALPARINWLMTALVNYGVPVALVTTPQFLHDQKVTEKNTGWTSEQFTRRVWYRERLPVPSLDDLKSVARHFAREGDASTIRALAEYAQASRKYLSAIETTVRRARYLASKEARTELAFDDVDRAICESSGQAVATELPELRKVTAAPLQPRNVRNAQAAFTVPQRLSGAGDLTEAHNAYED